MPQERLLTPVFVKINLKDMHLQVCKCLQQKTQKKYCCKIIKKVIPEEIISAQHIFCSKELSTYLRNFLSVLHNNLGTENVDNFVTFLMHINHNKVHNVLIQKDYVPRKGTKCLWQEIYQDAEGTTRIDFKTSQELVTYLNALKNVNVMHNNITEKVHDRQENVQEQMI